MKKNHEIRTLTEMAQTMEFPRPNGQWELFVHQLRAVVAENLNWHTAKSLDWDEDSQTFSVTVHDHVAVGRFHGRFEVVLSLDPRKPIVDELLRLQGEIKQFHLVCAETVRRAQALEIAAEARAEPPLGKDAPQ